MHMTFYKECLCCGKKFQLWELRPKATMKCPNSDEWRRVIYSKMPTAETAEKAKEVSTTLVRLGVITNGYHVNNPEDKKHKNDNYVVRINLIEDILERLMKLEPYEGARFHPDEIVCEECANEMRKKIYTGKAEAPPIKCPICETVLVPLY